MAKIFDFQNDNLEESCECPHCAVIDEFVGYALNAGSEEELEDILRGLYESGKEMGYTEALIQDIDVKSQILDDILE